MSAALRACLAVLAVTIGVGALLALGGCGDGEPATPDAPSSEGPAGQSKTAQAPGRPSPEALLGRLSARVAEGRGISDGTWTQDVQDVAMALWPDDASAGDVGARMAHTNLSHIAGDMAVQLGQSPDARAQWAERDATSVEIHDAWLEASARGPQAYRAWVVGAGSGLIEKRRAAMFEDRPR